MAAASKALTASGLVKNRPGQLIAVLLAAGADVASVTIYDNSAGSGNKLAVVESRYRGNGELLSGDPGGSWRRAVCNDHGHEPGRGGGVWIASRGACCRGAVGCNRPHWR